MAFRVSELTVERGGRVLFRNLSFTVAPGEILSVYGRNGSGKSSLLRVLAGLLEPLGGQVSIESHLAEGAESAGVAGEDLDRRFHYCGHLDAVKPAMTVRETLAFWAALYGGNAVVQAIDDWSLRGLADLPGQYLSAGQKRRVALARLSVAPRPIWLLDEPSAALDATAKAALIAHGEAHVKTGGIIVAASHEPLWPAARALSLDDHARAAA